MDEYGGQLRELEAEMESLASLGVTVIDVDPLAVRDIPHRKELEKWSPIWPTMGPL